MTGHVFCRGDRESKRGRNTVYSDLIDALIENNIEPYITLYHWELPYELYKKGGWMNRDIAEWFGEYAGLVAERFSDRVTHFFTLNEPSVL